MSSRRSDRGTVRVNKVRNGMTIHYPLAFISGQVMSVDRNDQINSINVIRDEILFKWTISNGTFKCLVPLKVGRNSLAFETSNPSPLTLDINLIYRPHKENERFIRILYVVCRDQWGGIFERGCFQSLPDQDNSMKLAQQKISLAILMLQTFMGETTPSHYSFRTETGQNGMPKVHIFTIEKTQNELWSLSQRDLWNLVAENVLSSKLANHNCKFLAFCSFTRYVCDRFVNSEISSDEIKKMTKGYVALGGGGLALLSSGCFYSWPATIDQIESCFTDTRSIDRSLLMDDSGGRGTFGGCYSNTFGALAHELGHIFDLGHDKFGIMSSSYRDIEKFFLSTKDSVLDGGIKWWSRSASLLLANHKWFNEHRDSLEDAFRLMDTTLRSRYGVVVIEYRESSGLGVRFKEYFLPAKWVKLEIHPDDCSLIAMDIKGNIFRRDVTNSMPSKYARPQHVIPMA